MSLTATERAEYWILTHLVDSLCPSWALRQEQVGYYYADYHGLTNQELIAVLSDLSLRGDLTAYRYDALEDTDEHYVPLLAEIEAAILTAGRDPVVTFCLTSQGGARWEEFFQPDWDKFLGGGFYYSDDMRYWELEATTKSPIEKYLVDYGIALPTQTPLFSWETLTPWNATYWKTLPVGIRCSTQPSTDSEYSYTGMKDPWFIIPESIGNFDASPVVDWDKVW